MRISSFPPIIGPAPQILILGSMPGIDSLRANQYYAHTRNHFWMILGEICGFDPGIAYPDRIEQLIQHRIALWDVLKTCERSGSLDQNIQRESEIPNELGIFLENHRTIRAVVFNGAKAHNGFYRHIYPKLPRFLPALMEFILMPSTSPANAKFTFDEKLAMWIKIQRFLL